MKRLILHIGTHKTGTTSLQAFFLANAETLLEKEGIRFFEAREKYVGVKWPRNAHFLLRYAKAKTVPSSNRPDRKRATKINLKAFKAEFPRYDTFLLSDERLWYEGTLHPDNWKIIKNLLDEMGFDCIDIVLYLRRQDLFIASLWNQNMKAATRVPDTLAEYASNSRATRVMNYDQGIAYLENVFGKEHIRVRVYERGLLEKGDIRCDFCSLLGITLDEDYVFNEIESNPGLGPTVAQAKLVANNVETYRTTDNFLYYPAIEAALTSGNTKVPMVPQPLRKEILDRYADGNARIAREYLGKDDGELFDNARALDPDPQLDPMEFAVDMERMLVAALAKEHKKRLATEIRLKQQGKRIKQLEKQVKQLDKRLEKTEPRIDGLNASLGPIARLRRKIWRKRQAAAKKAAANKTAAKKSAAKKATAKKAATKNATAKKK